jgi:lipopolysaccharide export system permease protein
MNRTTEGGDALFCLYSSFILHPSSFREGGCVVFGSILFRMILWELCKVFVMALIAITGILLMAGLIAEATQQGLGPSQILTAIPLLIPSTLPYTIPATTLFATCVVYGRLSADNEILAIKAAGVNLAHVVKPGIVLGLAMSASTMGLYYHVIPYTHHLLRSMVLNDAEELLYSLLRRHGMINNSQLPYAMFVKGVEGKKLISPVIKRKNAKGEFDFIATAREADLQVDVIKGQLIIRMRFGVALGENNTRTYFEHQTFEVTLPPIIGNDPVRARDLTWVQLHERRVKLREEVEDFQEEIDAKTPLVNQRGAPPDLSVHLLNVKAKQKLARQQIQFLEVEKLMRPALSLGCLCFILVGCPIGIWFSRGDYLSAFITCFLPIVLVYYPLMLCGTNLAKEARFNEVALVFGADVVVGMTGLLLFRKLLRN